ncbi:MAG TPA: hypothetical protein VMZ53_03845 [Kofleriaceae bacterium]|nr:hypothetical protein [Kofleriaceae bacterium]
MSQKMRGQELTMRIAVDGVVQPGSMFKLTDFTATPRTEIVEDDYLGEKETDLDIQHHGWDGAFNVDYEDAQAILLCEDILGRESNNEQHPRITITVIYTFRDPTVRGKIAVYRDVFLKQDEESAGGRKEKVKGKFSFKCKSRVIMNA